MSAVLIGSMVGSVVGSVVGYGVGRVGAFLTIWWMKR